MDNPDIFSRPDKENHIETVLYEMDMLDFCYSELAKDKWSNPQSYYLCIEGFLLHYRNLANFFANRDGMEARWTGQWSARGLSDSELASIQDERPYRAYSGPISQYLSHCTETRANNKRAWNRSEMYAAIRPCIENFRKLFPSHPDSVITVQAVSSWNMSTATMSRYSADPTEFLGNDPKPNK